MDKAMKTNTIRAFIAIELDNQIKQKLNQAILDLSSKISYRLRWVKPDLIHLTLNFLGNIPLSKIGAVSDLMYKTVFDLQVFNVEFKGMGCFPSLNRPRVIWIGMEQSSELYTMQKSLTDALRQNGFEIETRPFSPHLTLARVPETTLQHVLQQIGGAVELYKTLEIGSMEVAQLKLIKSDLTPVGPRYAILSTAFLKNERRS